MALGAVVLLCVAAKKAPPPPPCADVAACREACAAGGKGAGAACRRQGELAARAEDLPAAVAAWERACTVGDRRACVLLAIELYNTDDAGAARAREILEKTCDAGDGRACFNLSEVLTDVGAEAKVIAKREKQAGKWLAAECQKGNFYSCATLSRLHAKGYAVKQDEKKATKLAARAKKLMDAACQGGDVLACAELADEAEK